MAKKTVKVARPTIAALKLQATAAANKHAAGLSAAKSNHGRAPHGRDAKGKAKNHDAAKALQAVKVQIYTQTLNRLMKQWGY